MSSGVRRRIHERLLACSDDELKQAMMQVHQQDATGQRPANGLIVDIATDAAPLMQTRPDNLIGFVMKALIVHAAYRFAGLPPESRRFD